MPSCAASAPIAQHRGGDAQLAGDLHQWPTAACQQGDRLRLELIRKTTPFLAHSTPSRSLRSLAKVSTNSGEPAPTLLTADVAQPMLPEFTAGERALGDRVAAVRMRMAPGAQACLVVDRRPGFYHGFRHDVVNRGRDQAPHYQFDVDRGAMPVIGPERPLLNFGAGAIARLGQRDELNFVPDTVKPPQLTVFRSGGSVRSPPVADAGLRGGGASPRAADRCGAESISRIDIERLIPKRPGN